MIQKFKTSLLTRIVVTQIVLGILPLIFLGAASMLRVNRILKSNAIEFQNDNIKQGAMYINLVMDNVESLIANLSGIDAINNALTVEADVSAYAKLTTQARIGYILSGYTNLKGLVSIDLFSMNGMHYHVGETLNADHINEEVLSELYADTKECQGFVHWDGIEPNINLDSNYASVITAARILHTEGGVGGSTGAEGLLVVSYDPGVFSDVFNAGADQLGYTLILDKRDRIVYHLDSAYIGHTLTDELSAKLKTSEDGYFTQKIDGTDMFVVFDNTQKGNWTVAKFIPVDTIVASANSRTLIFVVLIAMTIAIAVAHGRGMSKQFIQPIRNITDTFRHLQSGNFTNVSKLKIAHQDEIGELGKLFNSFIEAREDITTQKKLERQLNEQNRELQEALLTLKTAQTQMVQQEKMAGIGQLAAGVAHEINNPLGFVKSNFAVLNKYSDRLERMLSVVDTYRQMEKYHVGGKHSPVEQAWEENAIDMTRSDLKEIISDTQEGLNRIAEIVNALKTFSRSSLLEERSPFDLNEGIKTTLLIANNEIKYNSTVNFSPSPLPRLSANGGQINQVLLNMIVNAAQAIKQQNQNDKGLITIETKVEGDYVCCYIGDNGCGMKDDIMNRIFEPFFTTKAVGQGTGLGLSLAYDIIVNKHGGHLEVTSEVGIGTCFKILLPINPTRAKDE